MIFDFHTHTDYADGANTAREMVMAAIAKKLVILGISEHSPRLPKFRYIDDPSGEVRGLARWSKYLAEMDSLKKEFSNKIELLKGCEVDWLGSENLLHLREFLVEGGFDYTIGSVHFIGEWGFDYEKDWEIGYKKFASTEEIYREYFEEYTRMVLSNLFDIGGHFDLIKKFNDQYPLPIDIEITTLAESALDALAKSKMVLEINSAGWQKPCAEQYPSREILTAARDREIPITLNSDAHSTSRIAENFERSKTLVKEIGYDSLIVFHVGGDREIIKI